jgi:hypothetical protein
LQKGLPDAGFPYGPYRLHGGGIAIRACADRAWAAVVITAAVIVAAVLITSTIAVMFGLS